MADERNYGIALMANGIAYMTGQNPQHIELGANAILPGVQYVMEQGQTRITNYFQSRRESSVPNLPTSEQGDMSRHDEAHGEKRKRGEEHHMEPHGHGNTPATGTLQANYIEKYVPVNFPDKIVLKHKYINRYVLRSTALTGVTAAPATVAWRTNSIFAPDLTASSPNVTNFAAHQPNQRDNWAAQYGYYRVESLDYKITILNTSVQTQLLTSPSGFVGAQSTGDGLVSLIKTQTATDYTTPGAEAEWEQKTVQLAVLPARLGGGSNMVCFHGTVNPEDFDMDPLSTAADETWTQQGNNPATIKNMAIQLCPFNPTSTIALLPEVGAMMMIEFVYTVQHAGYLPGLRQVLS